MALAPGARAEEPAAVFLVVSPHLHDPRFARSVVLAVRSGEDAHAGVIINRPTRQQLSGLFPDQIGARRVAEPVFTGGPVAGDALFALVRSSRPPGPGSLPMLPGLYLATREAVIDRVIENTPNEARYYIGQMRWAPGALRRQIEAGLWLVLEADLQTAFTREPEGLWARLYAEARAINATGPAPGALPGLLRTSGEAAAAIRPW